MVGGASSDGIEVPLATQWCLADRAHSRADATDDGKPDSTELDYALLKLASDFGKSPAPGGEERGWVAVRTMADRPAKGDLLFVAQHPGGQPLKLAPDVVLQSREDGLAYRLRYDANTEAGSSGSPCLNVSLDLVALHHAGDPLYDGEGLGRYNQGIPIDLIVADLTSRNLSL